MPAATMSLEELEKTAIQFYTVSESISQESIGSAVTGFFTTIKSFITKHVFTPSDLPQFFNENKYRDLSVIQIYKEIYRTKVPVPTGLISNYLTYIKGLNEVQNSIDGLMTEVLGPFEVYLGQLLNNPSELATHRQAKMVGSVVLRDLDKVKDKYKKHFSGNHEYRDYGQLIGNQAQWREIIKEANDLMERVHQIDPTDVQKKVTNIVDYLDTLAKRIQQDPENYAVSDMTLKDFAKISYAVAREVEFYASYLFSVQLLQNSIEYAAKLVKERQAA